MNQETFEDILEELRSGEFARLVDRLGAAYRRERGDCSKLRKALEHIKQWREDCISEEGVDNVDDMMMTVDAALAAPARNCDVGTAEEQSERFHALCDSNVCTSCPCKFTDRTYCALVWAQMPYEAGGSK